MLALGCARGRLHRKSKDFDADSQQTPYQSGYKEEDAAGKGGEKKVPLAAYRRMAFSSVLQQEVELFYPNIYIAHANHDPLARVPVGTKLQLRFWQGQLRHDLEFGMAWAK